MFRNEDELTEQELNYLYEKCHIWVQENYSQGNIIIALVGTDYDTNTDYLVHCFLYNRFEETYIDVRGTTQDYEEFISPFDTTDTYQFDFTDLNKFQEFLTELEENGQVNPDNY